MSKITLAPNASGTGTLTVAAPNTNTDRTITLPDVTTTLVGTDATQTLTNKTLTSPTITGATITGSTMTGGTITSATAVASTSGSTIDFTGIPSWAKRITVMFAGISTSGTSTKIVQIGSGSFTTSGYSGGGALLTNTALSGASATTGFPLGNTGAAADILSGNMLIQNITGNTWVASFSGGGSNVNFAFVGGGSLALGGILDRVRITTANGTDTFDAGTINIMYEG